MQSGCFPRALEGAHSTFHHLVTATLSSAFINKKIQLLYSGPCSVQKEMEPWHTRPSPTPQEERSPPPSRAQASFWRLPDMTPGSCMQLFTPPTLQQVLPEAFPTDWLPKPCMEMQGWLPCPADLQDSPNERLGASQNSADTP